jgi:hypothetical protein
MRMCMGEKMYASRGCIGREDVSDEKSCAARRICFYLNYYMKLATRQNEKMGGVLMVWKATYFCDPGTKRPETRTQERGPRGKTPSKHNT